MSLFDTCTEYEAVSPPGVRLPQIEIENSFYKDLGVDPSISNYEFLRQLCLKGVEEKKINERENKKEYFDGT